MPALWLLLDRSVESLIELRACALSIYFLVMALLSLFVAAAAASVAAAAPQSSTYTLTAASDFVLSGGAGVQAAPLNSLRSGNPNGHSTAGFAITLSPGITVDRLTYAYRYDTGYGPGGVGSNFTLRVAGQAVYASPHLTDYSYGQNRSNYSSPVVVDVAALGIAVPPASAAAAPSRIELDFDNNDRNVQLLLPFNVTVECHGGSGDSGSPCAAPPPPPTPPPTPPPPPDAPPRCVLALKPDPA